MISHIHWFDRTVDTGAKSASKSLRQLMHEFLQFAESQPLGPFRHGVFWIRIYEITKIRSILFIRKLYLRAQILRIKFGGATHSLKRVSM